MKPHVKLEGYDSTRYTVLVALKSGTVYVAKAYSYKAAAYRLSSQRSPSKDPLTYRSMVLQPGRDLASAVNYLIEGLQPAATEEKTP